MTVKELKDKLKDCPDNAEVVVSEHLESANGCMHCFQYTIDNVCWIEGLGEVDIFVKNFEIR